MAYFEFPHTRSYDGDLGFIIKRLEELTDAYNNFFDYNTIKFHDPITWTINEVYPANNIVYDELTETFYIAKKAVPAGIDISNTDYWLFLTPFKTDTQFDINSINPIANKPVTNRFNILETSVSDLNSDLAAEIAARTAGDNALQTQINGFTAALSAETVNREVADNTINARIDEVISGSSANPDAELTDIRVEYNGVTAASAGAAVRAQVGHIMDILHDDVGTDRSTFELTGAHSSTLNKIYMPLANNEKIYFIVKSSTGESISGAMTFFDSNNQNVGTKGFSTNTLVTHTMTANAVSMGAYINAPVNPCVITMIVYRADALKIRLDALNTSVTALTSSTTNNFNEIRDELGYANVNFVLAANHSSTADLISYPVASGKKVIIDLRTSNNNTISCSVVCRNGDDIVDQFAVTTGTPRTVTLSGAVTTFGAYVPYVEGQTPVVYFSIISEDSILFDDYDPVKVFKSDIDSIINDLVARQTFTNGINFAFISDIHWETNYQTSPMLVNYIADNTRIRTVINGGDVASGDGSDGTQQAEWLYQCTAAFNGNYDYYTINGNHDNNSVGGSTTLTPAQIRNLMLPSPDKVTYGAGNYYHFAKDNTRFICLDSGTIGAADSTQIAWAKNVIENCTEDYILIFSHIIYLSNSDAEPCTFFSDLVTMIGTLSAVNKAKIQAIFGGHTHHDNDYVFDSIPVIVIDTDSRYADDGVQREPGTTKSQLFDVVTINYDTKTIYCSRVGTIGTDRTITY